LKSLSISHRYEAVTEAFTEPFSDLHYAGAQDEMDGRRRRMLG
jgi:hypothetical protein